MQNVTRRALAHVRRDLVLNALDDYVSLSAITWEVRESLGISDTESISVAEEVARQLISTGMVVIGDLQGRRFVEWPSDRFAEPALMTRCLSEGPTNEGWLIATRKAAKWKQRYDALLAELGEEPEG